MNFSDRVPGIPDFTPIFDLIREERILSACMKALRVSSDIILISSPFAHLIPFIPLAHRPIHRMHVSAVFAA